LAGARSFLRCTTGAGTLKAVAACHAARSRRAGRGMLSGRIRRAICSGRRTEAAYRVFSLAARMGKVSDVPYTSVVGSGACTAKQSFVPTRRTPALPSCPRARSNASKLASWHLIFGRTAECKKGTVRRSSVRGAAARRRQRGTRAAATQYPAARGPARRARAQPKKHGRRRHS
jgi:hypothetical protein